jgi:hypothetical protein
MDDHLDRPSYEIRYHRTDLLRHMDEVLIADIPFLYILRYEFK